MSRVELIYHPECPNVKEARTALLRAFAELKLQASWIEWDTSSPESPPYVHRYGSPTVLVNGEDVAGIPPAEGADCCRIYLQGEDDLTGFPSTQIIAEALRCANAKEWPFNVSDREPLAET